MGPVQKQILTDEQGRPVAVQVDYASWLEIERLIETTSSPTPRHADLSRFHGVLQFEEDPLSYQRRTRGDGGVRSSL